MEDKMPQVKQAIVGVNRELYSQLEIGKKNLSAETIIIIYADKTVEILDASQFEEDKKLNIMEGLNKAIQNAIENPKNYKTLYSDDKNFEKIYAKVLEQLEKQENLENESDKNSKIAKIAVLTGVGALAVAGIAAGAYMLGKNGNDKNKPIELEEEDVNKFKLVPDITGKDINFYIENAIENNQKSLILNTNEFVSQNGKETWGNVTFNDEELENLKKAYPNLNFEGNEAIFGFTAEDMYSLALRFGHYSKDEYVTLTGGKEIDTVAVINDSYSMSNSALANIISYYICSDECDLNIEKVINFNENEISKIKEIEGMLAEYKKLDKEDGKEKEAEAKMKEIKSWFINYAYSADLEQDNAKSYILRTFLPACSTISEIHQYKDKIILNLYDTKTNENVTKEIKTALFDELLMRDLVLGYYETDSMGAFDAETFLEENKISKSRYNLLNTDVARSIADQSCSSQIEKLNQANEYISTLRIENNTAEAAYMGSLRIDLNKNESIGNQVVEQMDNVNTTYDNLTYGTYDYETLLEMVNNNLRDNNIYPKNINYFRTAKISEMAIEYKNKQEAKQNATQNITQGNKGDYVKEEVKPNVVVTEEKINSSTSKVVDESGKEIPKEQAMSEARQEDAKNSTEYDYAASTPEENKQAEEQAKQDAAARTQFLQNVYNATFNYYAGENVTNASIGYDSSWASSSDSAVVNNHNLAMNDGLKYKSDKTQHGNIIVEEPTISIPENAEIYDTPQAPVESVDNRVPDEVISDVPPEGFAPVVDEIKYESIPENAEVYNTPQAPVESVDNTISNEGFSDVAPEGFAPVVDDFSISSYSLADISDEEWEQLIIPVEDTYENSGELTGPTR